MGRSRWALGRRSGGFGRPSDAVSGTILGALVIVNVGFFVFNMIPFPPLDGSRLLYAVAPPAVRDVMDRIEQGGLMILLVVMLVGYQFIAAPVAKIVLAIVNLIVPAGPLP